MSSISDQISPTRVMAFNSSLRRSAADRLPGALARVVIALGLILPIGPLASAQTARPIPQADRVIIISIDGMRPDILLRAKSPNLHKLLESGTFTFYAETVPVAITLPSHVSMMTGVSVEKHGITWNDDRTVTNPVYPKVSTLFEVAKQAGLTTAIVSGKAKFNALAKPGTVDWFWAPAKGVTNDIAVAESGNAVLREHKPQVMLVHFPGMDTTGHASGWASPQQFAALERIDELIGGLLVTLENSGLANSTIVFVATDHGGSGKEHGARDPRSLYVPWIAFGPGIKKSFDLTSERKLTVNTTDTFATACYLLGIEIPPGTDGKPLPQIVEGYRAPSASRRVPAAATVK
jgi:predicted AlkP superfamily pyrophosphatase or phosphodiesterase